MATQGWPFNCATCKIQKSTCVPRGLTQQYLSGTVSYLNVVIAQGSELQAERAVMVIENRRWLAIAQLLKNLAGEWDLAQVQPRALNSSANQ